MSRQLMIVILLSAGVLLGLGLGGCASTPKTSERTGGVSLEFFVRADSDSFARYALGDDGSLAFAGGMNAHLNKYEWHGALTDEEIVELRAILVAHDNYRHRPAAPNRRMDTVEYTLDITDASGHRRHSVTGLSEDLEPLHQLLRRAALRRHQGVLDRLPQANDS